ncbi:MAG TPA: glucodextranase DOMON-like domain-containing protein [Bacillota bacterium]|nr:glucodextranase DOMON-like domain-containing protein [Bacillota bacterium]
MKLRLLPLLLLISFAIILMNPSIESAVKNGADPGIYFQMADPTRDEFGCGTYSYPTNIAFKPYQGLFDILGFKVSAGPGGVIYFDTTFKTVTNPWAAPEGYIHQNLRIYVDSIPEQGCAELPEKGAYVRFNPKYAWDLCLKIVGWNNSRLIAFQNGNLNQTTLNTELLNDHQTIRATVPATLCGKPAKNWHYYVFVGSYDGFGEDFFRKVMAKSEEWVIGGGFDEVVEPQIMDVLAPEKGAHSQINQLKSFDREKKTLAELYPIGADLGGPNFPKWLFILLSLALVSGIAYLVIVGPKNIIWFRVKEKKL